MKRRLDFHLGRGFTRDCHVSYPSTSLKYARHHRQSMPASVAAVTTPPFDMACNVPEPAHTISLGRTSEEAEAFWDEWMSAEQPFLDVERSCARADLMIDGAAELAGAAAHAPRSQPAGASS